MHEVKIYKSELLERLKANREQHRQEYAEAKAGYIDKLRKAYNEILFVLDEGRIPDRNTGLPEPSDHTRDYDHIIEMVSMSVDSELTLSSQEFAMYIMDNWGWKQSFTQTASNYR